MTPKALSREEIVKALNICSFCGHEYNYLLPTGYCVPCKKITKLLTKENK